MLRISGVLFAGVLAGLAASAAPQSAFADDSDLRVDGEETVRVSASQRYNAGRVHEFVFGGGYRDLWDAEIELPVLDIHRIGGGLTPVGRFGGLQTAVLGFKAKNGRAYTFRGTDKDPSAALPPILRDTFVRALVQDQMAAQHPGGPVAAGVLTEAAGVLTITERLVVMPDDPALGKYRKEFAGMIGSFYEYPTDKNDVRPGFHGATEILSHKKLYKALKSGDGHRPDIRAFLRARLMDILMGDFDRHRKQWRWAKLPDKAELQPIPEDRDQAFVRYDGVGQRTIYIYIPILQCYGPDYPFMKGLTLHGWEQDRWLLAGLAWDAWEPIVADIQQRLTDEVIQRAVDALPGPYAELDGERLRRDVTSRRDKLREGARAFYEHLAGEVNVEASDAAEFVLVEWLDDGRLRIEVRNKTGPTTAAPLFSRIFDPSDTGDVRIYLRGGNDRVVMKGDPGGISVKMIAEGGRKILDDTQGGSARLYDEPGTVELNTGDETTVISDHYEPPPPDSGFVDVEDVPPRDWGFDLLPLPSFGYQPDVGAFLGVGGVYTRYGFRKDPWAHRLRLDAAIATEAVQPLVSFSAEVRPENSKMLFKLDSHFSGIEVLRFYGFGNETKNDRRDSFYRVRNQQIRIDPTITVPFLSKSILISGGPWFQWSDTKEGDRLINEQQPYGTGSFELLGAALNFTWDTRRTIEEKHSLSLPIHDNPAAGYPTGGFLLQGTANISPPIADVEKTWGSLRGSFAGYFSFFDKGRLAFAFRLGGEATFGRTPYFSAASVGGGLVTRGRLTLRGVRAQRFTGEHAVYGNFDTRLFLFRANLLVPMDFGLMGFADVGRVFVDGENSNDWHPGGGGGIWFAPLGRTNAISFAVATSDEETLFYLRTGFHY